MNDNDRVAIIGAGCSGIAACQVLEERGIPFDCFEKGSDIGGLWRYENDNALASAYHCLHINTSRETARYASYPMPDDYPDYPHHTQVLTYLENYVEHFGLREKIRFRTEVIGIAPVEDAWRVQWRGADGDVQSQLYAAVLLASGHHWDPRWPNPTPPGTFAGEATHSHFYRAPDDLEGKNVLVVGMGDSAMDIACDTSRVSRMTFLTARRGAWIVPKYLGSDPFGQIGIERQSRLPFAREVASGALFNIGSAVFGRKIVRLNGRPEEYGLPAPDHKFGRGIPTASSEIFTRIGLGRVTPKPWISRLDGEQVRFEDGSVEDIDLIVYCTGYKTTFPFLSQEIVDAPSALPLYKRVVHPDRAGLYFIGLIDVAGPLNPLAELQTEWVADLLQGRVQLPSRAQMKQSVAREDRRRQERFGAPGKNAIYVDYAPYRKAIQRERKPRRRGQRGAPAGQRSEDTLLPAAR